MAPRPLVNHIEISAVDLPATARFYRELFDWQDHYDANLDYHMFNSGPQAGGAYVKVDGDGIKPGYVCVYVGSEDIEADLAKAQSLGATIMVPKTEIPNMGWFGIFRDPNGNAIGLYTGRG